VAGIAKVLDRESTRQGVAGFGVPRRLVAPAALALPVIEVAVAVALLDVSTAVVGAIAAAVLLAAFMAAIAISLARGTQPDCQCFGRLHSATVGRRTLTRDAVLALLALLVAGAGPGSGLSAWASKQSAVDWIAIVVAVVLAVAFVVEGSQLVERWRRRPGAPQSHRYPHPLSTGGDNGGVASRSSRSESSGR
jgi:prepilin signal peptidase PulO-like enzyme (type II secretory pathway)